MKRIILAVILAVALLGAQGVRASHLGPSAHANISAQDLSNECKKESDLCIGAVLGMIYAQDSPNMVRKYRACPENVTPSILSKAFVNYVEAAPRHSRVRILGGFQIMFEAFMKAYPCPK